MKGWCCNVKKLDEMKTNKSAKGDINERKENKKIKEEKNEIKKKWINYVGRIEEINDYINKMEKKNEKDIMKKKNKNKGKRIRKKRGNKVRKIK